MGMRYRLTSLATALLAASALLASSPAGAQSSSGQSSASGRDCQTIRTCNFSRTAKVRGCLSSYSCRYCKTVRSRCNLGGKRYCERIVCSWGG